MQYSGNKIESGHVTTHFMSARDDNIPVPVWNLFTNCCVVVDMTRCISKRDMNTGLDNIITCTCGTGKHFPHNWRTHPGTLAQQLNIWGTGGSLLRPGGSSDISDRECSNCILNFVDTYMHGYHTPNKWENSWLPKSSKFGVILHAEYRILASTATGYVVMVMMDDCQIITIVC